MLLMLQHGSGDFGTFACCVLPVVILIFIIAVTVKQANENKTREQALKWVRCDRYTARNV